jgi:hypothetical protein
MPAAARKASGRRTAEGSTTLLQRTSTLQFGSFGGCTTTPVISTRYAAHVQVQEVGVVVAPHAGDRPCRALSDALHAIKLRTCQLKLGNSDLALATDNWNIQTEKIENSNIQLTQR